MTSICSEKLCTGCGACNQICPSQAIKMELNLDGFWHPSIIHSNCLDCNLCVARCPSNINPPISIRDNTTQSFYVAWHKNKKTRRDSSSGGFFSAIAEYVLLKEHGVVFGVKFDRENGAVFDYCETIDKLQLFRGSKYVQSKVGDSYKKAGDFLQSGRTVLFCGTPCQIAGLRSFLRTTSDKLICLDIICHGTPSPGVMLKYLDEVEQKYQKKIVNYLFRKKTVGWDAFSNKLEFSDQTFFEVPAVVNPYMRGFLEDMYLNLCCHECRYTSLNRTGDITISDYWQYLPSLKHPLFWNGVSQVIVNSTQGQKWLNTVKSKIFLEEKSIKEASQIHNSLQHPFPPSQNRENFFRDYRNGLSFFELASKYFPEAPEKGYNYSKIWFSRIKLFIPQRLKDHIKSFLKQK